MAAKYDYLLGKLREGDEPTPGTVQTATASGASPVASDVASWPNGTIGFVQATSGAYLVYKKNSSTIRSVELS